MPTMQEVRVHVNMPRNSFSIAGTRNVMIFNLLEQVLTFFYKKSNDLQSFRASSNLLLHQSESSSLTAATASLRIAFLATTDINKRRTNSAAVSDRVHMVCSRWWI